MKTKINTSLLTYRHAVTSAALVLYENSNNTPTAMAELEDSPLVAFIVEILGNVHPLNTENLPFQKIADDIRLAFKTVHR